MSQRFVGCDQGVVELAADETIRPQSPNSRIKFVGPVQLLAKRPSPLAGIRHQWRRPAVHGHQCRGNRDLQIEFLSLNIRQVRQSLEAVKRVDKMPVRFRNSHAFKSILPRCEPAVTRLRVASSTSKMACYNLGLMLHVDLKVGQERASN